MNTTPPQKQDAKQILRPNIYRENPSAQVDASLLPWLPLLMACALVFSCLFVFLLFGGIKLLRGQKPQLIRLRGIACALLAGVLVAPPVIASQEYLFMCKVLCILKDHSPGTVIREPEQPDYLEARWWSCGGYTLRSRKLQDDVWRFDVPD